MLTKSNYSLNPIYLFLLTNFAISSIFYFLIIYSGKLGGAWGMYSTGIMWSPGISAIITLKLLGKNISDIGWKWGNTKYQLQSYLIPILYGTIAYMIIWGFGFGEFYNLEFVNDFSTSLGLGSIPNTLAIIIYVILASVFGTIMNMGKAMGEEIGWRGFLAPELFKRFGFTTSSLIVGLIWGLWHLPLLLFADYNSTTPLWFALTCFMILVIAISFIFTWYRIKSGSLWTAVILHATHNKIIQGILTPLTSDTGNTNYYIDEFGIIVPLVTVAFAIYFWSKRKELKDYVFSH